MAIKVGMVSLGCSKNQVDAEIILAKLRERGYQIHTDSGTCDVVIVNTCGFIESAKQESIENILEFCYAEKRGAYQVICVTGCHWRALSAGDGEGNSGSGCHFGHWFQ